MKRTKPQPALCAGSLSVLRGSVALACILGTVLSTETLAAIRAEPVLTSLIEVSWEAMDGADGYVLERSENDGPWIEIARVGAAVTRFQSVGMRGAPGRVYRHRVRATGAKGGGDWIVSEGVETPAAEEEFRSREIVRAADDNAGGSWKRHGENCLWVDAEGTLVLFDSTHDNYSDHDASHINRYESSDDGATWRFVRVEFPGWGQGTGWRLWKPGVARVDGRRLVTVYTKEVGGTVGRAGRRVGRYSDDDGQTWSEECFLTPGGYVHETGYGGNSVVALAGGRVVTPYTIIVRDGTPPAMMIGISDDGGETWRMAFAEPRKIPGGMADEPSIVEYAPGKLTVFIRAKKTGYLYHMRSDDAGETWTEPLRNVLRHGSNPVDVARIPGTETIVLVANSEMDPADPAGRARHILASQLSDDGGLTWYNYREIENVRDWTQLVDYPAIAFKGAQLHVAFRHLPGRRPEDPLHDAPEHVRYLRVDRAWLTASP